MLRVRGGPVQGKARTSANRQTLTYGIIIIIIIPKGIIIELVTCEDGSLYMQI